MFHRDTELFNRHLSPGMMEKFVGSEVTSHCLTRNVVLNVMTV